MSKATVKSRVWMGLGIVVALALAGIAVKFAQVQRQDQQKRDQEQRAWEASSRIEEEWLGFKQERLIAKWRRDLNAAKAAVVDEKLGHPSADPVLALVQHLRAGRPAELSQRVNAIAAKIEQAPKVCDAQIDAVRISIADERDARTKAMQEAGVEFTPANTAALRDLTKRPHDLSVRDKLDWGMCRDWYEKVYSLDRAPLDVRQRIQTLADLEAVGGEEHHYTLKDAEDAEDAEGW